MILRGGSPAVWRVLYKGILRISMRYDRYPLSKVLLEKERRKYPPNVSLVEEVRKKFRDPLKTEDNLLYAFGVYKYLCGTFYKMEETLPWYNRLTLPSIEPQLEMKPVLVNEIKPGNVLISHPTLTGAFDKTVILIVKSNADETLGVIIPGKPLKQNDITVWQGGIITSQELFLLHSDPFLAGQPVLKDLFFSSIYPDEHKKYGGIANTNYRIYCTVSKWNTSQLETEIRSGSWFMAKCPSELLFPTKLKQSEDLEKPDSNFYIDLSDDGSKTSDLWKKLMRSLGGEYSIFSYFDGQDIPKIEASKITNQ
jgi:putative AlgH/UPF0301 family transcriptional regulator